MKFLREISLSGLERRKKRIRRSRARQRRGGSVSRLLGTNESDEDEAMEFNPSGYRGDPGIPHSDTATFGYLLACSNVSARDDPHHHPSTPRDNIGFARAARCAGGPQRIALGATRH